MQRRDKLRIRELADFWKEKARQISEGKWPAEAEQIQGGMLTQHAIELEKLLDGQPTEGAGFRLSKK